MSNCMCRQGFFTLRDCDQPATATCGKCSRTICRRHRDPAAKGAVLCVECAAVEEQAGRLPPAQVKSGGSFGGRAFYRRRDEFYRARIHRPVYWGTAVDPYYDCYDFVVFHHHHHHHDHMTIGDSADQDLAPSLMDS